MIPQNELRIGNLVNYTSPLAKLHTGDEPYNHVHEINKYSFWQMGADPGHDFDPIPITADWLIRFGFKMGGPNPHATNFYIDRFGISYHFKDGKWYSFTAKVEYIHQLQNLYFSITGKELELKQNA